MNLFCPTYRPPRLTGEFEPRVVCAPLAALACHKGDSKAQGDTQTSTQTGAQTAGAAVTGDKNVVNTGAQFTLTNSGITVTDQGAVQAALDSLSNALSGAGSLVGQSIDSLSLDSTATLAVLKDVNKTSSDALAAIARAQDSGGGITAWLAKLTPVQWVIAAAFLLAGLIIVSRRNK